VTYIFRGKTIANVEVNTDKEKFGNIPLSKMHIYIQEINLIFCNIILLINSRLKVH